jgi:hypothetical protein
MSNTTTQKCDLNDSNNSRKKVFFPSGFDGVKEYKLYKHMGKPKYRLRDGEAHCDNYVTWMNHIKQIYKGFNENDRLQFKWALRDKKKYAELGRTIIISVLLALFALILPPFLDYAAADYTQNFHISNETVATEVNDENDSIDIDASTDLSEQRNLEKLYVKAILCFFVAILVEIVVLYQCSSQMGKYRFADEVLNIIEQTESDEKSLARHDRRITVMR